MRKASVLDAVPCFQRVPGGTVMASCFSGGGHPAPPPSMPFNVCVRRFFCGTGCVLKDPGDNSSSYFSSSVPELCCSFARRLQQDQHQSDWLSKLELPGKWVSELKTASTDK